MESTTSQQFRAYVQEVDARFGVWKSRIGVAIFCVVILMIFKSFNNQHQEIRAIQDSISNFYREFDVSMLKNPAELKDFIAKVSKMSEQSKDIGPNDIGARSFNDVVPPNYDIDKTGRPDLAAKVVGGRIAGIGKNTKMFYSCNVIMKLLNCPTKVNGPEKAIEISMLPNECFAFRGQNGTLFIKLMGPAMVDSVTVEHIPAQMMPTGDVSDAPKVFSVFVSKRDCWKKNYVDAFFSSQGLNAQYDTPHEFGTFTFLANDTTIKTFNVNRSPQYMKYIQFDFIKNNGNPERTCIYSLRVHGLLEANVPKDAPGTVPDGQNEK